MACDMVLGQFCNHGFRQDAGLTQGAATEQHLKKQHFQMAVLTQTQADVI